MDTIANCRDLTDLSEDQREQIVREAQYADHPATTDYLACRITWEEWWQSAHVQSASWCRSTDRRGSPEILRRDRL